MHKLWWQHDKTTFKKHLGRSNMWPFCRKCSELVLTSGRITWRQCCFLSILLNNVWSASSAKSRNENNWENKPYLNARNIILLLLSVISDGLVYRYPCQTLFCQLHRVSLHFEQCLWSDVATDNDAGEPEKKLLFRMWGPIDLWGPCSVKRCKPGPDDMQPTVCGMVLELLCFQDRLLNKMLKFCKFKMADGRHIENRLLVISTTDHPINAEFCKIKQNRVLTQVIWPKYQISKKNSKFGILVMCP